MTKTNGPDNKHFQTICYSGKRKAHYELIVPKRKYRQHVKCSLAGSVNPDCKHS